MHPFTKILNQPKILKKLLYNTRHEGGQTEALLRQQHFKLNEDILTQVLPK
jgi:hypothetical protein